MLVEKFQASWAPIGRILKPLNLQKNLPFLFLSLLRYSHNLSEQTVQILPEVHLLRRRQ
jgi:hypothetical protein